MIAAAPRTAIVHRASRSSLAACRAGDTLVVTKLDRLARSLRDVKPRALWRLG